jgi:hypothetical protein
MVSNPNRKFVVFSFCVNVVLLFVCVCERTWAGSFFTCLPAQLFMVCYVPTIFRLAPEIVCLIA